MTKRIIVEACKYCPYSAQYNKGKSPTVDCRKLFKMVASDSIDDDCPLDDYEPYGVVPTGDGKLHRVYVEGVKGEE